MAEREAIYDETGSKLLVQALLAPSDIDAMAALNGLRRYIERENLPPHEIKVFFAAGPVGTWMRGVMSLMQRAEKNRLDAETGMVRYRKRLALVETALRRLRSILKDVGGSDTKDNILQWHIQNTRVDESAKEPDDADYMHLLTAIPTE